MMEKEKKSKKGILTLAITFAILFAYAVIGPTLRGGGCPPTVGLTTGQEAPLFVLGDMKDDNVSLDKLKGKVVLVNFWLTSCEPCRKELPALSSLYKKYLDRKDFAVVAINCDDENAKEEIRKLFDRYNIELPVALDPDRKAAMEYGVFRFPETFFIDKTGKIRFKFVGARDWTSDDFIKTIEMMLAQ